MTKYIIRELQNPNSIRQGEVIEASSLTVAKRAATRMQVFQGTYMLIELANEDGSRTDCRLAIKEYRKWHDYQ